MLHAENKISRTHLRRDLIPNRTKSVQLLFNRLKRIVFAFMNLFINNNSLHRLQKLSNYNILRQTVRLEFSYKVILLNRFLIFVPGCPLQQHPFIYIRNFILWSKRNPIRKTNYEIFVPSLIPILKQLKNVNCRKVF